MKHLLSIVLTINTIFLLGCSKHTNESSKSTYLEECVIADSVAETNKFEINGLRVYVPEYDNIYLVCGKVMPEFFPENSMTVAAAYTSDEVQEDEHMRIAGDHVSDGVRYKGYSCDYNTGAFVYWDGKPQFIYDDYSALLDSAKSNGGVGFGQDMIIYKGKALVTAREKHNTDKITQYRALCLLNDTLCVIESINSLPFSDFKNELITLNVSDAIYLDMGDNSAGWYRDSLGTVNTIREDAWYPERYSNFLLFTKSN